MLTTLLKFTVFVIGFLINIATQRLLAPRTVFNSLATTSLLIAGGALATPFWQQLAGAWLASKNSALQFTPAQVGAFFLILAFTFAWLSHRSAVKVAPERLVDTKMVSPPIWINGSRVFCYCGTVLTLSEAEVVVTSENTELDLGSVRGISMSGRMRRAAAEFRVDGTLLKDNLSESVTRWRSSQVTMGPYAMGTCFASPPFNAASQGIKSIVHAVAIQKNGDNTRNVDAVAIHKIIAFTLKHCEDNGFRSVFIPVFGIGSSGLNVSRTGPLTVNPLVHYLNCSSNKIDVYLGIYRASDAALVGKQLLEAVGGTR